MYLWCTPHVMAAFWCTAGDTIYLHHFRFSFSKQFLSSFTHLDSLYFHFSSFRALLFLYFSLFPVQHLYMFAATSNALHLQFAARHFSSAILSRVCIFHSLYIILSYVFWILTFAEWSFVLFSRFVYLPRFPADGLLVECNL